MLYKDKEEANACDKKYYDEQLPLIILYVY